MDTEKVPESEDSSKEVLSRFFSQKTVEEQFVLEKFTEDMLQEVLSFEPFFTEDDVERILTSTDSKGCLYTVASILSRVRGDQLVSDSAEKAVPICSEETRKRWEEILSKK